MGRIATVKVMRQLAREGYLPDEIEVSWDASVPEEVAYAEKIFLEYLDEGWIAFKEDSQERMQIFRFDPKLKLIMLEPPLPGG